MNRQQLHKIEMDLVKLCEDNEPMKEVIIDYFTDLMNEPNQEIRLTEKFESDLSQVEFVIGTNIKEHKFVLEFQKNGKFVGKLLIGELFNQVWGEK